MLTKVLLSVALCVHTQINKTRAQHKRILRTHFQPCAPYICAKLINTSTKATLIYCIATHRTANQVEIRSQKDWFRCRRTHNGKFLVTIHSFVINNSGAIKASAYLYQALASQSRATKFLIFERASCFDLIIEWDPKTDGLFFS